MGLTTLQFSYVLLGIIMNLMSLRHAKINGSYYTPTRPAAGIAVMLLYGMSTLLAGLESQWLFRLAMGLFLIILAGGGVITHLAMARPDQYASGATRWVAVIINSYGVVLTVFALTVSFMEP